MSIADSDILKLQKGASEPSPGSKSRATMLGLKEYLNIDGYNTGEIRNSGRLYCYNDARWVTNADDNYGTNYYQFVESGGTGVDPIQEWEHKGDYVRAGTVLHELAIFGRLLDAATLADLEILVSYRNPEGRWDTLGLDNDGEDTHVELWRGFWKAGGTGVPAITTPVNDDIRRAIPLGDYVVPQDGDIRIYFKPVNVDPRPDTTTDYVQIAYNYLYSIPKKVF